MTLRKPSFAWVLVGITWLMAGTAMAQEQYRSQPWQLDLQPPKSPVAQEIVDFHNMTLVIITLITIFVLGLLAYVIFRYRESANPTPSKTTHNTVLEVVWTLVPILILVVIAIPSFKLLYKAAEIPESEMTLKVIGHQWYWAYEYPDHGNFTFDSYIVPEEDLKDGQPRLLTTDNKVYLPTDTNIRVILTAADVLHNWAIPALGLKTDTVPGRLNEVWVNIEEPGTYYGMCSELCGTGHGFMPIEVEAVSREQFDAWVAEAQTKFARVDGSEPTLVEMPEALDRRIELASGKAD